MGSNIFQGCSNGVFGTGIESLNLVPAPGNTGKGRAIKKWRIVWKNEKCTEAADRRKLHDTEGDEWTACVSCISRRDTIFSVDSIKIQFLSIFISDR